MSTAIDRDKKRFPADPESAKVLFGPDLPGGEQEGEPAALATEGQGSSWLV